MKDREFPKLSTLAWQRRRQGLAQALPRLEETLRGSLIERYLTCGNPNCQCARGKRHGPVWHLTVTLAPGRTTGVLVSPEQLEQARQWVQNYHTVKEHLEKISQIHRELLRRKRRKSSPFRHTSLQQLEADLAEPNFQRCLGVERQFRDDPLRYSLSRAARAVPKCHGLVPGPAARPQFHRTGGRQNHRGAPVLLKSHFFARREDSPRWPVSGAAQELSH
jgi:hypothetical protein